MNCQFQHHLLKNLISPMCSITVINEKLKFVHLIWGSLLISGCFNIKSAFLQAYRNYNIEIIYIYTHTQQKTHLTGLFL